MRALFIFLLLQTCALTDSWSQDFEFHDLQHYLYYDYETAMQQLDHDVMDNPTSPIHLINRAKYLQMHGQTADAERDLKRAAALSPFMIDLYFEEGRDARRHLIEIQPEKAMITLDLARRLLFYSDYLEYYYAHNQIGYTYFSELSEVIDLLLRHDFPRALTMSEQINDKNKGNSIGQLLYAIALIENDLLDKARDLLEQILFNEPELPHAWYNLSTIEAKVGAIEEAKIALEKAIRLDSSFSKAHFDHAQFYGEIGEYEKAITSYNKVLTQNDNLYIEALVNRGLAKKMLGDFQGALSDINLAMEIHPDEAILFKNRANLYLIEGEYKSAIEDYKKAIQLDGNFPEAIYNKAIAHLLQYEFEQGCIDMQRAAQLGYEPALEKDASFCHLRF
ncbi:MAG: tetratricopeptide repeat protein [Saprospiraceae bacterium]|nr:tetratricopeptide repeat protein [Saprospiraceae bacterium]